MSVLAVSITSRCTKGMPEGVTHKRKNLCLPEIGKYTWNYPVNTTTGRRAKKCGHMNRVVVLMGWIKLQYKYFLNDIMVDRIIVQLTQCQNHKSILLTEHNSTKPRN